MSMYRQEKLIEKLVKFRFRKYNFSRIKVEVYDRFDGDTFMCRLEVFKGGKSIKHRVMKHEGKLTASFVVNAENKLVKILVNGI